MNESSLPTSTTASSSSTTTTTASKNMNNKRTCPTRPYSIPSSSSSSSRLPARTSVIGFGCSSISHFYHSASGEPLTKDNITKNNTQVQNWISALQYAVLHRGITLLDTAPWYGHGVSEIVIGYALEDMLLSSDEKEKDNKKEEEGEGKKIGREDIIINTKIGRYEASRSHQFDFSYNKTISSTQLSIQRMKCHYIDVLQLHDAEFTPSISLLLEETIPAMVYCRDVLKIVKALGITGYPLEVQHEILVKSSGGSGGGEGMVFDQSLTYCHANLHDESLFEPMFPFSSTKEEAAATTSTITRMNKQEEEDDDDETTQTLISFATYCSSKKISLLTAAPFSMGLLTSTSTPPRWHSASPSLKKACKEAALICNELNVDLAHLALMFALSRQRRMEEGSGSGGGGGREGNGVVCVIVGMKNVKEVEFAVDAALRFASPTTTTSNNKGNENEDKQEKEEDDDDDAYLKAILTPNELTAYEKLRDASNGPFASVWSQKNANKWNGMDVAEKFWSKVEGGKEGADVQMRKRC